MTSYRLKRIKTNNAWPPGDMSARLSLDFLILDAYYFYDCNAGDIQVFCAIITMATCGISTCEHSYDYCNICQLAKNVLMIEDPNI